MIKSVADMHRHELQTLMSNDIIGDQTEAIYECRHRHEELTTARHTVLNNVVLQAPRLEQ